MARRAYILSFDIDDDVYYIDFHYRLTSDPNVITWSHYLKSSYILITSITDATTLNETIRKHLPQTKRFLLFEVNLKNINGQLAKEGWEWFRKEAMKIE